MFKFKNSKKGSPLSFGKSKSEDLFWILTDQFEIFVFETKTAKIILNINLENDSTKEDLKKLSQIEKIEHSKKMKLNEEFINKLKTGIHQKIKLEFDESECLILIPSLFGIAIFDILSQKLVKLRVMIPLGGCFLLLARLPSTTST